MASFLALLSSLRVSTVYVHKLARCHFSGACWPVFFLNCDLLFRFSRKTKTIPSCILNTDSDLFANLANISKIWKTNICLEFARKTRSVCNFAKPKLQELFSVLAHFFTLAIYMGITWWGPTLLCHQLPPDDDHCQASNTKSKIASL